MPYRHAHWWLLALLPIIGYAFWPTYVSQLRTAPLALHAHGITAMAWVLLVMAQGWSVHKRRLALHRTLGLATFAVVPLFVAAGAMAVQGIVALHLGKATPFHVAYGGRLAAADAMAAATFVWLAALGLRRRRSVHEHAAAMLATVLLVLPPILGRVFPRLPGFPGAIAGRTGFELSFDLGMVAAIVIAAMLAVRYPRGRRPYLIVAGSTVVQMVAFDGVDRIDGYPIVLRAISAVPPALLATGAFAVAGAALWIGWRGHRPAAGGPAVVPMTA